MAPRVSVIIPAHNAASTLAEAIVSARRAARDPVEIIVVESGSTDETAAVAERLLQSGDQLLVAERPGAAAARNLGFAAARGEWIQFLDADDWLEPDAIEAKLAAVEATGDLALGARLERPVGDRIPPLARVDETPANFLLRLWWGEDEPHLVQTGQWFIHRDLATAAGPWNESLLCNNDGEFFARAALAAQRIVPVSSSVAGWNRQLPNRSLSTRQDAAAWASRLRSWELTFAAFVAQTPGAMGSDPRFLRARQAQFSEIVLGAAPHAPKVAAAARAHLRQLGVKWLPSPFLSSRGRQICRLLGPECYRRLSVWRHSRNEFS